MPLWRGRRLDAGLRRDGVARIEDDAARDRPEHGHVLEAHLGRAVLADADADVRAADLDVGEGVGRHPDLVVGPGQEGGEGGHERDVALGREAHAHADHVLLGDEGLEGPSGKGLEELVGVGRVLDVAVDGHDASR